jgi:hypothetical protein
VKLARGIRRLADRKGHLKMVAAASTGDSGSIASSSQRGRWHKGAGAAGSGRAATPEKVLHTAGVLV